MALRYSSLILVICLTAFSNAVEILPGAPASLHLWPGEKKLTASWSEPRFRNFFVNEYKLIYGNGTFEWPEVSLPKDPRRYVIEDLESSTNYIVCVRALNKYGSGSRKCYSKVTKGPRRAKNVVMSPLPRVFKSVHYPITSTSLALEWDDDRRDDTDQPVKYTVRYRPDDPYASYTYVNTTGDILKIEGLTPSTTYEFSARRNSYDDYYYNDVFSFWVVPPFKATTKDA